MSRVLFIVPRTPYPLNDGWIIRTYNLIQGLSSQGYAIDLISFVESDDEESNLRYLLKLCCSVYSVKRKKEYSLFDISKGLVTAQPFSVLNYYEGSMRGKIDAVLEKNHYDFIQVEDIVMAQYLPVDHGKGARILDMHNIESMLMNRYARNENNVLKKAYAYLTAYKLRKYEEDISNVFDVSLVCSERDRERLLQYGTGNRVEVIPNGVDCAYYESGDGEAEIKTLVFVGSMDYHANITGICHFVSAIFPLVSREDPNIQLRIVGKNPNRRVRELSNEQIIVTGEVEDVRTYLGMAHIVIVPLLVGGGTRLKILEAMAMSKAIVSTSIACEGIEAKNGENIMIADDDMSFSEIISSLLRDAEKRSALGSNAREFVEKNYDWPIIHKSLHGVYRSIAA